MLIPTSYQGIVKDGVIRLRDVRLPEGTPVLVRIAAEPSSGEVVQQLEARKQRALQAAGRFHSGTADLSTEHDRYLLEAYHG
ncbi:MAG: hypothetical protein KA765_03490 [Thermoflexales bacterium]|nr:hypothetical protein [Thermoflexales bacterium]